MRFDELGLDEAVLQGLDAMNFQDPRNFRRKRYYRLCPNRHRKNGSLYSAGIKPDGYRTTIR